MLTQEEQVEIFKRMCYCRYFEYELIQAHQAGKIKCPIYLSLGQESIAATLSVIHPDFKKIFPQHRGHSVYISYGESLIKLRDEILGLNTGCCEGQGGSSDIGGDIVEPHHGLMAENIPIAAGYAFASRNKTLATFGDGAVEEDYALAAFGFIGTHKLPILLVCEDNGLAILTKTEVRRRWNAVNVLESFGIPGLEIDDSPVIIAEYLRDIKLPFFVNIKTTRERWHVGSGCDEKHHPETFIRFSKGVRNSSKICDNIRDEMKKLWDI